MILIDSGFSIQFKSSIFISAFSDNILVKPSDAVISDVKSDGIDILDDNSVMTFGRPLPLFDRTAAELKNGIAGSGLYIPQKTDIITSVKMLSTDEILLQDVWSDGFLFISGSVGLVFSRRQSSVVGDPHGSILIDQVGNADGVLQIEIEEDGLVGLVERREAFCVKKSSQVVVTYNVNDDSNFP